MEDTLTHTLTHTHTVGGMLPGLLVAEIWTARTESCFESKQETEFTGKILWAHKGVVAFK